MKGEGGGAVCFALGLFALRVGRLLVSARIPETPFAYLGGEVFGAVLHLWANINFVCSSYCLLQESQKRYVRYFKQVIDGNLMVHCTQKSRCGDRRFGFFACDSSLLVHSYIIVALVHRPRISVSPDCRIFVNLAMRYL